jgi:hypothetical protein
VSRASTASWGWSGRRGSSAGSSDPVSASVARPAAEREPSAASGERRAALVGRRREASGVLTGACRARSARRAWQRGRQARPASERSSPASGASPSRARARARQLSPGPTSIPPPSRRASQRLWKASPSSWRGSARARRFGRERRGRDVPELPSGASLQTQVAAVPAESRVPAATRGRR